MPGFHEKNAHAAGVQQRFRSIVQQSQAVQMLADRLEAAYGPCGARRDQLAGWINSQDGNNIETAYVEWQARNAQSD